MVALKAELDGHKLCICFSHVMLQKYSFIKGSVTSYKINFEFYLSLEEYKL